MKIENALYAARWCCITLLVCLLTSSCNRSETNSRYGVFSADIGDAIKQHIDEQARLGNGTFNISFQGVREKKSAYSADRTAAQKFLKADALIPKDERFDKIVKELLQNGDTDLVRARSIDDHIIDHMRYMKYGEGWGKGDAVHTCNSLYGNCTDFHSYFIALARAAGIPARSTSWPIPCWRLTAKRSAWSASSRLTAEGSHAQICGSKQPGRRHSCVKKLLNFTDSDRPARAKYMRACVRCPAHSR